MRLSHVENRIEQQLTLRDLIDNAVDNLTSVGYSNITPQRVHTRLASLKETWEKFSVAHDAIGLAMTKLSPADKLHLQNHSYFSESVFSITHEFYFEAVEKMNVLLYSEQEPIHGTPTSHNQSGSQTSNMPIFFHHARLPRIDIPKFNGSPSDWLSFKDLFSSLVLANPTLTSVEKLQYLKTSLVGSASHLLKNTTLTADNFQKAWDALISFYENKRLLVNAALHSLLTLKRMSKESASEMEQLYTNIMQIYRTLETLHRPVGSWDDFLVFIAVQRLDSESVKAWEHHLGSSKEPPTWQQFSEFLITRLLSLQAFEKSRIGKIASQQHQVKSHFQGKAQDNNSNRVCSICASNHYTASCPQYNSKNIEQRLALIVKNKLCYNCLGSHRVSACRITKRCHKCGHKHHTTIHQAKKTNSNSGTSQSDNSTATNSTVKPIETNVLHSSIEQKTTVASVFLTTAQVVVITQNGETAKARALIDQGSEISLISERLAKLLRLPRKQSSISLVGIGAQKSNKTKGITSFKLKPNFETESECSISAHILPKLTTSIPSVRVKNNTWPHLKGIKLADPDFNSPGPIDIILGADAYSQIIEDGIIKDDTNTPIAQRTIFGWIISGPSGSKISSDNIQSYNILVERELYDLLHRFWELEEIPSSTTSSLSPAEQECEQHFLSTHTRDTNGRYILRLPFKQSATKLGDSRSKAMRMIKKLSQKLASDPSYSRSYTEFMDEYERLQHMQRVQASESESSLVYYLPHHGVVRENSLTTKLRVVFNGSSRTDSGYSLNDILHTGAKLQSDLINVLIWFRRFCYVFSNDVEKMYRQIKIHPKDWNFQRIFWIDHLERIIIFILTTVTYGQACSPFLALHTFLQLIHDKGAKFPLAVSILKKGRYVDDIFGGADTIEEAQKAVQQLIQLCMAGGFPLHKWVSNRPTILESVPLEKQIKSSSVQIEENTMIHALGLCWKTTTDTFHFTIDAPSTKVITKRSILSTIAKLFDPLGLISPVVIKAKILMQELWSLQLEWDDPLPEHISTKWIKFVEELSELSHLTISLWLGFKADYCVEIHGFCDASQQAIAAIVYIRSTNKNGEVTTSMVCSKTKVAPLKRMTIPRLELSGAVMLVKLVAHVLLVLDLEGSSICMWTDSEVTLTWINNHPSRWQDFVHNRVCLIQETLPQAIWRFVPGTQNPADCATRGLTPIQLSEHFIWWTGPQWLRQSSSTWPRESQLSCQKDNLEERTTQVSVFTSVKPVEPWDLLHKYSSLTRLLRITSWCFRIVALFRKSSTLSLIDPITTQELENAKFYWIKVIQQSSFHEEINMISKGQALPKSSSLLRLTPFMDSKGLLRIGGRLQFSLLPQAAKHPLILPKSSTLSSLIIADAHLRTMHGGTQVTLAMIRNEYWIIGGRTPVRSFILKCVKCTRYRQKRAQQIMGQLPIERITPSRPFLHSGIDYAGSFLLKTWRGKNSRTYKAYIALFVCESTSDIHIELVTDYTTDAFIAAFTHKRFTARRGICATLRSDCGTNLKGADAEIQKLFSSTSKELGTLAKLLANDGTQWRFNPPAAPHFGGKWEAGVRSVKYHLKRIVGDTLLTYEEMTTLLTQIEAVLNSRPLSPLSENPDDLNALTPGHFIIGSALAIVPEPSLEEVKLSLLSRWQLTRQMLDSFWSRWSKECLQRYLAMYKWNRENPSIQEGSLVRVVDERFPPSKWPLGRITQSWKGWSNTSGVYPYANFRTQTTYCEGLPVAYSREHSIIHLLTLVNKGGRICSDIALEFFSRLATLDHFTSDGATCESRF